MSSSDLDEPARCDPTVDNAAARVVLSHLAEPGDRRLVHRVQQLGAPQVVSEILENTGPLPGLSGYRARLGDAVTLCQLTDLVERDLTRLSQVGGRLVLPGASDWPTQLDDLGERQPLLLWVRGAGDLRLSALRSVAIVGARACTAYGENVAVELAGGLSERGWCVVSGGAYGIDAAAHRGVLGVQGCSVAILACGADVAYPKAHDRMLLHLLERGVVLSEAPLGAAPHRGRFLVRNRVIAALTRGTVVVEAALRSGSLSTVREAAGLGRVVMGIPGSVTSAMSAGVHRELREGALLVSSIHEVIEAVGDIGTDLAPRDSGPVTARDHVDAVGNRILDAMPANRAATDAQIATSAGVNRSEVMAALGLLELEGFVTRDTKGWRLTSTGLR
jgi:DNA processing protein